MLPGTTDVPPVKQDDNLKVHTDTAGVHAAGRRRHRDRLRPLHCRGASYREGKKMDRTRRTPPPRRFRSASDSRARCGAGSEPFPVIPWYTALQPQYPRHRIENVRRACESPGGPCASESLPSRVRLTLMVFASDSWLAMNTRWGAHRGVLLVEGWAELVDEQSASGPLH